jgi:hypothetical protein
MSSQLNRTILVVAAFLSHQKFVLGQEPLMEPEPPGDNRAASSTTVPNSFSNYEVWSGLLKPGVGEIGLWGRLISFNASTGDRTLQAEGFVLPDGRCFAFAYAKNKIVRLMNDVTLAGRDEPALRDERALRVDELQVGHWVYVVGRNDGTGKPLDARSLFTYGENQPEISAPVFPEAPPPAVESGPSYQTPQPVRRGVVLPAPPATALMTFADISPWLRKAATVFPDTVRLLPLVVTGGGRPVMAVEIAPSGVPPAQVQRMVVICRQHGDEPETTAAGLEFMRQFLLSRTPRMQRMRRDVALLIVPVANPDGAWRKQRRNAQRHDLNRDWGRGRTREVVALTQLISAWKPHLLVDVHQWVPSDGAKLPMVEAAGGYISWSIAAGMSQAARSNGFKLAFRASRSSDTLCHRYWARAGVPSILLETTHNPRVARQRHVAIDTTIIALQRALDGLVQ